MFNPLAPNDVYISRTAQLISRRCILNIYSTNILTEYFKHVAHSPFFFSLQDAVQFIMLSFFGSCNIHILNTGCAKIKKNSGAKGLIETLCFSRPINDHKTEVTPVPKREGKKEYRGRGLTPPDDLDLGVRWM